MAGLLDLLPLLAQGVGAAVQPQTDPDAIYATGRQAPVYQDDPAPRPLGNRSAIEESAQAKANSPQHKGMFGVRGTLRDVLGMLGDSFLLGTGRKSIYSPQRDEEKRGDALSGFTQDPMAAIERLTQAGGSEMAQKMFNDFIDNQTKAASAQSLIGNRDTQARTRDDANLSTFQNQAGRVWAGTQDKAVARQRILSMAKARGINLGQLGLSDNPTDEELGTLAAGDMTVNQQQNLPVAQQNANSREYSAHKASAPRATPNPTSASIAAPILAKIAAGKPLTKGEQDVVDRTAPAPKKGGYALPPLPAGF